MSDTKVVLVTGASSGFGALAARGLAKNGHTVYAGMRETSGRNSSKVAELEELSAQLGISIQGIEMDVQNQDSVDHAVAEILTAQQRIDVVVHNAGHMVLGPTEAFTVDQVAELYDINVLSTQRVNRAVLPHLRQQRSGLLVWVASSSTRGGHPPFLAPYFAAKAGMDALAESYAAELIRFGIDTAIVVPGAYTSGTNHFAHATTPADTAREAEYDELYGHTRIALDKRLADIVPPGSDPQAVADEIARVVDLPFGERPFRSHIDPSRDGSAVVTAVADRIRHEFYHRVGIADLLTHNDSL
ncbi:SDR family oxidoreductase [Nocardia sp. NPDC052278]|uniref:SDR family oxidoreductase n=1 Tax=unclassified Nocardia TaxID=2637762 RepID=UPI0036AB14B5